MHSYMKYIPGLSEMIDASVMTMSVMTMSVMIMSVMIM